MVRFTIWQPQKQFPTGVSSNPQTPVTPTQPTFAHVVLVVLENHSYSEVIGNSAMPYLNGLAQQNGLAAQYYSNTHPSLPNYFMLTTGQTETTVDSHTGTMNDDNAVRELVKAGKSWKCYAESLPSPGYTGGDVYPYARQHNPFSYISDVQNDASQAASLVTAVLFIQRMRSRAAISMVTYTSENISGLDISSPVRYRGVPVGRVTDLRVDPRETTIEIDFEVTLDRLSTVGFNVSRVQKLSELGSVARNLRAQIVPNPITGEAYLLLDMPKNPPPPMSLDFKPTRPYVPSMPSIRATVQDRLPAVLDRAEATMQTLREIVGRIPDSLDRSDRFFTNVERSVQESQLPVLSADSRRFFTTTSAQIEQIKSEMDGLMGTEGSLVKFTEEARAAVKDADFPAMTQSTRDAADSSRLAAEDLRRSLPAIRDSLEQMRELARQLEEQPESVVYGPRKVVEKHQ